MNCHGLPAFVSFDPIFNMINGGTSRTSSTTQFSRCNNFSASFLNAWNKCAINPGLINKLHCVFAIDSRVV